MVKVNSNRFENTISIENLFLCWEEFKQGKQGKPDVQLFEYNLEENIYALHRDLKTRSYKHGPYYTFHIYDPKFRVISKATVRDRLVHHAIFNELNELFDPTFIYHSYASRLNKGTHVAVKNLAARLRSISGNFTKSTYVLKCDIKKFFKSIDHQKLLQIIQDKIQDKQLLWLIEEVIVSFPSKGVKMLGGAINSEILKTGLPIGNLSSQIFANIYLNELDQFMKHALKVKNYFRYADDFVIASNDAIYLNELVPKIKEFLQESLVLSLHPDKVSIGKLTQGIDFLGYIILPFHTILRTRTKRRMFSKLHIKRKHLQQDAISEDDFNQTLRSYLGILTHGNNFELRENVLNEYGLGSRSL